MLDVRQGRGIISRMVRMTHPWLRTVRLAGLLFCLSSGAVFAQKPVKPPETEGGVLPWVIALGLMVVIGVSAFLNPKRSHLN